MSAPVPELQIVHTPEERAVVDSNGTNGFECNFQYALAPSSSHNHTQHALSLAPPGLHHGTSRILTLLITLTRAMTIGLTISTVTILVLLVSWGLEPLGIVFVVGDLVLLASAFTLAPLSHPRLTPESHSNPHSRLHSPRSLF
eukprot:TRINITY_DN36988_c0_g2_i1.p3 TRINITY_DN36988_c0_g2~~TRINITY_DN36988_c0_g2_i1.p3  ORF type:complete len:143 (-),score=28.36 TRINITY_DN36988_c0_g2_i1:409-837(-)